MRESKKLNIMWNTNNQISETIINTISEKLQTCLFIDKLIEIHK